MKKIIEEKNNQANLENLHQKYNAKLNSTHNKKILLSFSARDYYKKMTGPQHTLSTHSKKVNNFGIYN